VIERAKRHHCAMTLAASVLVLGVGISWPAEASPGRDDCIVGARPSYAPGLTEAETRALEDEVMQVVSDKYFKLDVPPVEFGFGAWVELTDFYLRFGTGCDRRMDNAAAILAVVEHALSGKVTFDVIVDYPPGEIRRVLPTETARREDMPKPEYERRDCIVEVDAMLLRPTTGDAFRERKKRITEFV